MFLCKHTVQALDPKDNCVAFSRCDRLYLIWCLLKTWRLKTYWLSIYQSEERE